MFLPKILFHFLVTSEKQSKSKETIRIGEIHPLLVADRKGDTKHRHLE